MKKGSLLFCLAISWEIGKKDNFAGSTVSHEKVEIGWETELMDCVFFIIPILHQLQRKKKKKTHSFR